MRTKRMAKVAAAALAMVMCVPTSALAGSATPIPTSGSFNTSFDVYSPALTVSVPVNLDIKVNPLHENTATGVKKFEVASNSIDIMNASVDVDADVAIPVNVTVKAAITNVKDDVVTEYNTFTASQTSKVKRINLKLSEAQTDAQFSVKTGGTAAFDSNKKLDLSQYEVTTAAAYGTPAQSVAITKEGSLLSMDIAGPATTDTTNGATYSTDATKVKATVGSFAVTGVANTSADWKADDLSVAITYDVKASAARNITTPTVAAVTWTSGASATDLTIAVTGVGEATVTKMLVRGTFGEYPWSDEALTIDYTTTPGTAAIKVAKDDGALTFLSGDDYKTKAQDLVIVLSDGRVVVTTLTVN